MLHVARVAHRVGLPMPISRGECWLCKYSHGGPDFGFEDHGGIMDDKGKYLCHCKVQAPLLYHTWTCHLSTLSCGMFFRRRLVDPGGFLFNANYRCGGDGEWMVRLLRAGVRMAAMGEFTSVFTRTDANLSRGARAREEWRRLRFTAPAWARAVSPLWVAHHRFRRWRAGAYRQSPFEFSLFTHDSPDHRVCRQVEKPLFSHNW